MLCNDEKIAEAKQVCMIMSQIKVIAIRRVRRNPLGCMKEKAKGSIKEKKFVNL